MQVRKFTVLIIILLVAVVGVFGVVFFTQQTSDQLVSDFTKSEEIDTSEWKTYRNEEYGFEFEYPINIGGQEYRFHDKEKENGWFINNSLYVAQFWPLGWQDYMFRVEIVRKDDSGMIDEFMKKIQNKQNIDFNKEELYFNNVKALKLESSSIIKTEDSNFIHKVSYLHFFGNEFDYFISAGTSDKDTMCETCYWVIERSIKSFQLVK